MLKKCLFVNHIPTQCGVYEYGKNVYNAIKDSARFEFIYLECDSFELLNETLRKTQPAAVIFNYHVYTMPWLIDIEYANTSYGKTTYSSKIYDLNIPLLGIIHESCQYIADEAIARCKSVIAPYKLPYSIFDYYISADPTIVTNDLVFKTGRPLFDYNNGYPPPKTPVFSCATLATHNKGFERIIKSVQNEYDEAVIRINMPYNSFTNKSADLAAAVKNECLSLVYKPKIQLQITHEYFTTEALLNFLAKSTANFLLYETKFPYAGCSSATDYALSVKRPIVLSGSVMFRHILNRVPSVCIDNNNIRSIVERGFSPLEELCKDWSPQNLMLDYERILDSVLSSESFDINLQRKQNNSVPVHFFLHISSGADEVILTRPFIARLMKTFPDTRITLECKAEYTYLLEDFGLPVCVYEHKEIYVGASDGFYAEPFIPTPNCGDDALFLNMWFGVFNMVCKTFGFSYLNSIHTFNIYMRHYQKADDFLLPTERTLPFIEFYGKPSLKIRAAKYGVLIENDTRTSLPANTELSSRLHEIAEKYPELTFYCTQTPAFTAKNIVDLSDLNLLEISELSNRCIAFIAQGGAVNAASLTELNKHKFRCFFDWRLPVIWTWQLHENPFMYASDFDSVITFIGTINRKKDDLKKLYAFKKTDNSVTGELYDKQNFVNAMRVYSTSGLCKFLCSIKEVDVCADFFARIFLAPHECYPKTWELAHIIYDLSDGNLLDMGSSDSYILLSAIALGIPGEKYGIDLRLPTNPFPNVNYLQGDLCNTGLPNEHFQNITCLSVLEHGVNIGKFVSETSRLLKKSGRLYVTFDYWEPKVDSNKQLYGLNWNIFDKNDVLSLIDKCAANGLSLIEDIDWHLGEQVITPKYWSGGDVSYTFGMLAFEKIQ